MNPRQWTSACRIFGVGVLPCDQGSSELASQSDRLRDTSCSVRCARDVPSTHVERPYSNGVVACVCTQTVVVMASAGLRKRDHNSVVHNSFSNELLYLITRICRSRHPHSRLGGCAPRKSQISRRRIQPLQVTVARLPGLDVASRCSDVGRLSAPSASCHPPQLILGLDPQYNLDRQQRLT